MSSVRFELLDKDEKVIDSGESHCRNILGDRWRNSIDNHRNLTETVRVIAFDSPIDSLEESHRYFESHPQDVKQFNAIFHLLLEGQPIKVELLKKNGTWKAYFSDVPSYPLVGLVLQFLRERDCLLQSKEVSLNEIMKSLFHGNNYSHLDFISVLFTAYYVFTIKTKRTLLLSDFDIEDGPAEYIQRKLKEDTAQRTLTRIGVMLRRYKKSIVDGMVYNYYENRPPSQGDSINSVVFKNLEGPKLIKLSSNKNPGTW
jgi:hypothetical protein